MYATLLWFCSQKGLIVYEFYNAPQVIAENLSADEIQGLKAMFQNMDTDKSGTITYEELKTGLARLGSKLTEAEVKQLMEAVREKTSISRDFY